MLPKIFLPLLSLLLLVDLIALANGTYVKIPAYSTTTAKPVTTFATTTAAPGSGVKLPSYPIALPAGQAVVEVFVVIDKELGDVFQGNYGKIVDYLSIYFWDINTRYKSLWSVDISFKFSEVLVIRSTSDQPFIEKSRAADGRTNHERTLPLFSKWSYERLSQRPFKYDMAVLLTNSQTEWGGGLAWGSGACRVDTNGGMDYGTVVWNDRGVFDSVTVAAHEIGHNLGALHDDDPDAKCPGPYGFIMSGATTDTRYFFQRCSDAAISNYVKSDTAACLRRIDGPEFVNINSPPPQAGTMVDSCKALLNDTKAFIDSVDASNCRILECKQLKPTSDPNVFVVWGGYGLTPVENIQCGNGGRCFRGKCRAESKLLRNEASGFCMNTNSRFGFSVPAQMFPCPKLSQNKTPLETLEIINVPNGKLLATPYLYDENKESGNRCFYTGVNNGDALWTDRCGNLDNPWHVWEFRAVNGNQNRFQLVHKVTGRCAKIVSNASNSDVNSLPCTTDSSMIWSWVDGV